MLANDITGPLAIKGFKAILDGECDEIPEQCFRLKGGIDDVYAAYEEMKKEEA